MVTGRRAAWGLGVLAVIALAVAVAQSGSARDASPSPPRGDGRIIEPEAPATGASRPGVGAAPIAVRPFRRDGDAPAAPTALALEALAAVEVAVVRERRAPVADALVIVFDASGVLAHGTTDAAGIVRLDVPDRDAEAVTLAPAAAPVRTVLPRGRRLHDVVLADGVVVSGRLFVDGVPAAAPYVLELGLVPAVLWGAALPVEVSAAIWSVMQAAGREVFACTTGDGGHFRFTGIEAQTSVCLPQELAFDATGIDTERSQVIAPPCDALELHAHRVPMIRGRVVTAGSHAPLPGAFVGMTTNSSMWCRAADSLGRFQIPVETRGLTNVTLSVRRADGLGRRDHVCTGDFDAGIDVGDLETWLVKEMPFIVRDMAGNPVAGAVARCGPGLSARTDATGRGVVLMSTPETTLRVACPGFRTAFVELTATGAEPVPVRLERSTRLVLRVVARRGELPSGLTVIMRGAGQFIENAERMLDPKDSFRRSPFCIDDAAVAAGATQTLGHVDEGGRSDAGFAIGARDEVVVSEVVPGVPLQVTVVDTFGTVLTSTSLTLGPTEDRTVELLLDRAARRLTGVVRLPDGEPAATADVILRCGTVAPKITGTTGSDGRFAFDGVMHDEVSLDITRGGFAPIHLPRLVVPQAGDVGPFVLAVGGTLRVALVDVDGAAVKPDAAWVWLSGPDGFLAAQSLDHGVATFAHVSDDALDIQLKFGHQWVTAHRGVGEAAVRVVVPAQGNLRVVCAGAELMEAGASGRVCLTAAGSAEALEWYAVTTGAVLTHPVIAELAAAGEYDLTVETLPPATGQSRVWTQVGPVKRVRVTAGETTTVTFP